MAADSKLQVRKRCSDGQMDPYCNARVSALRRISCGIPLQRIFCSADALSGTSKRFWDIRTWRRPAAFTSGNSRRLRSGELLMCTCTIMHYEDPAPEVLRPPATVDTLP